MSGLTAVQRAAPLVEKVSNALPERAPDPPWRRFVRQCQCLLTYIMRFAPACDASLRIPLAAAWLPATSRLLGNASTPAMVVFGVAGLSWAPAKGVSRAVWRQKGHP